MKLAGQKIPAGHGVATVIADFDFETFSEAGYVLRDGVFKSIVKSGKPGLPAVGLPVYAEHPSTEVLSLAYDLKDGVGPRQWLPWMAPPLDLFAHIEAGKLIEAHNSLFEFFIWHHVCHCKMGWPALPLRQTRDSMAKCKAWSIPGALGKAGEALGLDVQKDKKGAALMKLTKPRKPTKALQSLRFTRENAPQDFKDFDAYGLQDIASEAAVSTSCPDLSPDELAVWMVDQAINVRGVQIDQKALAACVSIINQAFAKYNEELRRLTAGSVSEASQIAKLTAWLFDEWQWQISQNGQTPEANRATVMEAMGDGLDADNVEAILKRTDVPESCRRALEIRASIGSASVKKAFALDRMLSNDGRMRDLFRFCGADRTGRFAGAGPQPQNMPNSGPKVHKCSGCRSVYWANISCPKCGDDGPSVDWGIEAVESALPDLMTRDLALVEAKWGDATAVVSGVLRGLFVAAEGKDLICSDYSAIEAVVAAMLADESWRIEVFRTHGKIYEAGASKIAGIPLEEILEHKERTGEHHPLRKKVGKVSELASGYAGWIGAWKNFGADKFMNDEEIKQAILAWRAASPNIVEMWGGQYRKHPDRWEFTNELFGLEGCVVAAIQNPGACYSHNGIAYGVLGDVLYCQLPSGRKLSYHQPRLTMTAGTKGRPAAYVISYMAYNTDYTKGRIGWVRLETYSGKLFENLVQAVARDILTHAMVKLEAAGYPIVLHVHDEIVCEIAKDFGSVEEFERIMAEMPEWAKNWPIRAAGGWRGKRYRKD